VDSDFDGTNFLGTENSSTLTMDGYLALFFVVNMEVDEEDNGVKWVEEKWYDWRGDLIFEDLIASWGPIIKTRLERSFKEECKSMREKFQNGQKMKSYARNHPK